MYAAPFTIEKGRSALAAILSAFETPPHQARILAAKQEAGNSMIRYESKIRGYGFGAKSPKTKSSRA